MGPRVQEEHGLGVRRHGGQPAAVGTVRHTRAFGGEQPLAGREVADVQVDLLAVERRCGNPPAVRADRRHAEMPAGDWDFPADAACGQVPNLQVVKASAHERRAVGYIGQAPHDDGVVQGRARLAARRVPQSQLPDASQRPSGLKATG